MSWMQKLTETYENCRSLVGVKEGGKPPLAPVYHTTQQAQIEAVIGTDGSWRGARVLEDKSERTTLIPCTEKSAARTSSPEPHPLFDTLAYLAGDYTLYRRFKEGDDRHERYMDQLAAWCASLFALPKVCAVLRYLQKGSLMDDLIRTGILVKDENGTLPEKWDGDPKAAPPIFRAVVKDQADAFVRFQVVSADGSEDLDSRIWEDPAVWNSYIGFVESQPAETDWCYVLGTKLPVSGTSPKYIRRPGDGAKLISANDSEGFTYRGRFTGANEALCISRKASGEAHAALRWLIQRQGYVNGEQVILAWCPSGAKTVNPCENSLDLLYGLAPDEPVVTTGENFAKKLRRAAAGYGGNLEGGEGSCVIGLDSATPGRLSIFYYRELPEKDLVERVAAWHRSCSWRLQAYPKALPYQKDAKPVPFTGAPSPETIAEAAYGKKLSDGLKKSTVQRLLPCIVDGAALPRDLMQSAARRASNPGTQKEDQTENEQTLGTACALIRCWYNAKEKKERWKMALDLEETDRSYLFGRALAYAQKIESDALYAQGENRSTNAERMRAVYSQHPARTLKELDQALIPYIVRLESRGNSYGRKGMEAVISRIPTEQFTNEPLTELFLLGYACQMEQFRNEINAAQQKKSAAGEKGEE